MMSDSTPATAALPTEQVRALVNLLYPDHMTPTAKRMFEAACHEVDDPPDEPSITASSEKRAYRTVYRRQHDLERHPDIDPERLPVAVYSSSNSLEFARSDLVYLRDEGDEGHGGVAEAWMETRMEHPWERTDD